MKHSLLSFLCILLASNASAQVTSPAKLLPQYHFKPNTSLQYIATEEQWITDPKHLAHYTDEYYDSTVMLETIDAITDDGNGVVSLKVLDHKYVDRCRRIDENALRVSHGTYAKGVRLVIDHNGDARDSSLTERSDEEAARYRTFDNPNVIPEFEAGDISKSHKAFVPRIPRAPRSGIFAWSDTNKDIGRRGALSMRTGTASSSSEKLQDQVIEEIVTTINAYRVVPDTTYNGISCSCIESDWSMSTPTQAPDHIRRVTFFRKSDGALLYMISTHKFLTDPPNPLPYETRKIIRLAN